MKIERTKKNPIAKAVRTPAFKMQVVKDKTKYDRKKTKNILDY